MQNIHKQQSLKRPNREDINPDRFRKNNIYVEGEIGVGRPICCVQCGWVALSDETYPSTKPNRLVDSLIYNTCLYCYYHFGEFRETIADTEHRVIAI